MKYMVFVIYVIIVGQFITNKLSVKGEYAPRGHAFYKIRGVINIIIGLCGMCIVNFFLRDKDIIPQTFVWIAIVGFIIVLAYGLYCIYKAMITWD